MQKGLGDSIEKVTKKTGIKKAVKLFSKATGIDCGCEKRKDFLNKMFPYLKPNCLTEKEYDYLKVFFSKDRPVISMDEQRDFLPIYNRVFKKNQQVTNCSPCIKDVIDNLKSVFDAYK